MARLEQELARPRGSKRAQAQEGRPEASRAHELAQLALTGLVLLAATAGGALMLAVAENGNASYQALTLYVTVPAASLTFLVAAVAKAAGLHSFARATALGLLFGAVSTAGLEVVRNIGFYEFNSMPGQLPELMGVLVTNRIMLGPTIGSDIAGWALHVWNGAAFGVTFALLVGGFPRLSRYRGHWYGTGLGVAFGALVGTGFLASPVSRATGAGTFGSVIGAKYDITVYLAHMVFGAILGTLVHRSLTDETPVWELALRLLRPARRRHRLARV